MASTMPRTKSSIPRTRATVKAKVAAVTIDQLTDQLASGLTISNAKGKQKATTPSLPLEEQKRQAMRSVNSASQSLSSVVQSGWKRGTEVPPKKSTTLAEVNASAASAAEHLVTLRDLCPGDLDVERAAVSILSKLVALEMFEAAALSMAQIHPRLCTLTGSTSTTSRTSRLHLVSIPLPSSIPTDSTMLTLIMSYLTNALIILSQTHLLSPLRAPSKSIKSSALATSTSPFADFAEALEADTLLKWLPSFSSLPAKQTDAMLTRSYNILTKTTSTSQAEPQAVFAIRVYALRCLAGTSPGVIERPDTLWDQAIKLAGPYVKTAASKSSASSEDAIANAIVSAFGKLVLSAEERADKDVFMSGKGFVGFCEYWMGLATRLGDLVVLNRIVNLIQGASVSASSTRSKVGKSDDGMETSPSETAEKKDTPGRGSDETKDQVYLEAAKVCATLAQTTAILDPKSSSSSDIASKARETSDLIVNSSCFSILSCPEKDRDDQTRHLSGKLERAIERTRRAALSLFESPSSSEETVRATQALLVAIVDALERVLSSRPNPNFFTQIFDTLFVLARKAVVVTDPRTYKPAYDYLARAMSILNIDETNDVASCDAADRANYFRCLSGAFHNIAGTLYQAERHGSAIGFLKDGCELGVKALDLRKTSVSNQMEGGGKKEDAWKQLEEQLYRRWQLLGVCYSKIGDRKLAFHAFLRCIRTFPYSKAGFVRLAGRTSLSAVFSSSSGLKELANIVDRISHIGACELLVGHEVVSLRSLDIKETSVAGALVERQVECLNDNRRKEGVREIIVGLMRDAIGVYEEGDMPIRRARVLLGALEFAYYVGPEHIAAIGSIEDIGKVIEELLSRETYGQDSGLSPSCNQYRAASHLWLALHAHRRADANQAVLGTLHADKACDSLMALLAPADEASAKLSAKTPPKKVAASKKTPPPRRVVRKAPPRNPMTPKPKSRKALQDVSLNAPSPPKRSAEVNSPVFVFDEPDKLLVVLKLAGQTVGLLGLVLPKIRILDVTRRLAEHQGSVLIDEYIIASADLAYEYLKLGKTKRASTIFNQALPAARGGQASDEACVLFFLKYAEYFAAAEDIVQSSSFYCEALALSDGIAGGRGGSSVHRSQARAHTLERAAVASHVYAMIQYLRDDISASLESLLQSLRLWNRALETLTRSQPTTAPSKPIEDDDPFATTSGEVNSSNGASQTPPAPHPKKSFSRRASMDGLEWRISSGLLETLFHLCQAYFTRGSVREAEYFAQQAADLAESLNAPAMIARALTKKGELQLHQGLLQEGYENFAQAVGILQDLPGMDAADVHRLQGEYKQRNALHEDAQQSFELAREILEELNKTVGVFDGAVFGPRRLSSQASKANEIVFPELLATVLRQYIWLLRDDYGGSYDTLLEHFTSLPSTSRNKAEENMLNAKLTLHEVYKRFRADMFLNSIAESTIALPMGTSSADVPPLSPPLQDIMRKLDHAEDLFWTDLELYSRKASVSHVRESVVSLALIRAFQTSLGRSEAVGPLLAASLLDACSAITLHREMLEAIQHKCLQFRTMQDDLQWRLLDLNGTPRSSPQGRNKRRLPLRSLDIFEDEEEGETMLQRYWESLRSRYQSQTLDAATLSSSRLSSLSSSWSVVHISVTDDKSSLFVSRQSCGQGNDRPLVFCVPLKGRRDGSDDEDEHLTFEDALKELDDIITQSNETTKAAVNIKNDDQSARTQWWKDRSALDIRLRDLLENIEFCWLGAFKTILTERPNHSPEVISNLRIQFDKVFQQSLRLHDKKTKQKALGHKKVASESYTPNRVTLADEMVECFSMLSPQCRDEELEDLVYFVLDLYQFHGVPVAIAEIDIDQVVVDLRTVLEEHAARMIGLKKLNGLGTRPAANDKKADDHMFLVLDKNVQGLPWESIPVLRGRSVSRIPSIDFLLDRVELARWQRQSSCKGNPSGTVDRAIVDPRKGYYMLNPSGDLSRTEGRFKDWAKEMESVGWEGVIGSAPSEQQIINALQNNDLVVYFGHGGAEQYVHSHKIRSLPKCAAVMLWGCSSGALRELGDFDRIGTPFNYMVAGCPALVVNIWDVTDREIDRFAQSVFDKLHLTADSARKWTDDATGAVRRTGTSVVSAVAQSRDSCKLKYLTGAAPIVYGIPFYL